MKRISMASMVYLAMTTTVFAVVIPNNGNNNTNNTNNNTFTPNTNLPNSSDQFNPMLLPGQEFYNNSFGKQADPFFGPNMGTVTPNTKTTPTPNPYPNFNFTPDANTTPSVGRFRPGVNPSIQQTTVTSERKWRLGVYSKDIDIGCRIMDVVPGLAAARAGLEAGDLIVAVNGYQVGYINGQLYDCGTEFERTADKNGWVTLLVQNTRDKTLMNVPVQLDSKMSRINGSLSLNNNARLPNGAIVKVELQEVVGNGNNAVTFASAQIDNITSYPIPFSVDYDPAHISASGTYVVNATVLSNGREIYKSPQGYRLVNQGRPIQTVSMQLERARPTYQQIKTPYDEGSQVAQIVEWFNQYLGRRPSDQELAVWLEAIKKGYPMSEVQLQLAGHGNFFNRCNQDPRTYVTRVHELIVNEKPNEAELQYWLARYDSLHGSRRDLALELQQATGIRQ